MLARLMCVSAFIAFILPTAVCAACPVSQAGNGSVTVTFGSKDCPRTAADKAAFARTLKLAVAEMNSAPTAQGGQGLRSSSQNKLYNIADLQYQSQYLAGRAPRRYFDK